MTFEEAKVKKQFLDERCEYYSDELEKLSSEEGKELMGITPDHVREMSTWKILKFQFDESLKELQNFNKWYVKNFKKEIAEERKNKYKRKAV